MLAEPDNPDDDEPDPVLEFKQAMVRLVAIHAVEMIEDILDEFDDPDKTGLGVLAAAVTGMCLHRFNWKPEEDEKLIQFHVERVRECITDLREEETEANRQHRGDH